MSKQASQLDVIDRGQEWAVILAGGDGTRLKSLTRKIAGDERPKQFCSVLGKKTLLEETQNRTALELARERTLYVVNRVHELYYEPILRNEPASNLVVQPSNRGTAPAILYSLLRIAAVDSKALVAFLPSDHYISDNETFMAYIRAGLDTARRRPDLIMLLGLDPETPEVEYGWIEPAEMPQENKFIKTLYERMPEINFSYQVLALHPERLAVLKVIGVKWSDWASQAESWPRSTGLAFVLIGSRRVYRSSQS